MRGRRRAYLFAYSSDVGTRESLKTIIDAMPEIVNWKYELPYTFYLISELSAVELAQKLRNATGHRGRLLVVAVGADKQGWLDADSWNFLSEGLG